MTNLRSTPWRDTTAIMDLARKIYRLRRSLELNQAEFGKKVGASQPTVAKWERGKQIPDTANLKRLAALAGETIEEFDQSLLPKNERLTNVEEIEVVGAVQGGVWAEALEKMPEDRYTVSILRDPTTAKLNKFGLEVEGSSMNRAYLAGSVVICVPVHALSEPPTHGDHVIVYREREGLAEATIKEMRITEDGSIWLFPDSSDPMFQTPIQYRDGLRDGETVRIHALVIGSYQPRRRRIY